jgi:hypothetical protein
MVYNKEVSIQSLLWQKKETSEKSNKEKSWSFSRCHAYLMSKLKILGIWYLRNNSWEISMNIWHCFFTILHCLIKTLQNFQWQSLVSYLATHYWCIKLPAWNGLEFHEIRSVAKMWYQTKYQPSFVNIYINE